MICYYPTAMLMPLGCRALQFTEYSFFGFKLSTLILFEDCRVVWTACFLA